MSDSEGDPVVGSRDWYAGLVSRAAGATPATFGRRSNVDEVRVVQMIEVQSIFGSGVQGDPVRVVTDWFRMDGEFAARHDSWADRPAETTDG